MVERKAGRTGAKRWRQWTEKEARAALTELGSGNESVVAFARRKGCSAQRIWYWKKRLGLSPVPGFVAVALPTAAVDRWIEIDNGQVVVRVREALDVAHVARLVGSILREVGRAC